MVIMTHLGRPHAPFAEAGSDFQVFETTLRLARWDSGFSPRLHLALGNRNVLHVILPLAIETGAGSSRLIKRTDGPAPRPGSCRGIGLHLEGWPRVFRREAGRDSES
jgi:hypothetical protein